MFLTLLSLILLEQRYILLIAGAVILLLAVTLVVYFRKRMKKVEKEPEEDWNLGMQSLFIKPPSPAQTTAEPITDEQADIELAERVAPVSREQEREDEIEIQEVEAAPLTPFTPIDLEAEPIESEPEETEAPAVEHTQLLYSEPNVEPPVEITAQELEPESRIEPSETEPRGETAVLGTNATDEAAVFDEEVWARLETAELQSQQADQSINEQAEQVPPVEQTTELLPSFEQHEPRREARVEQRAGREPFEPPRIELITHSEPFEPPTIEPLTPREQASFMQERGAQARRPQDEQETTRREDRVVASSPFISDQQDAEQVASSNERAIPTPYEAAPADHVATAPPIESVRMRKAPAGSVLGLPAETSDKPLVLGEPVRPADDAGIEALSRYGSRPKEKTGHAGTIALLIILLLVGGAIGAYFIVPAFRNWVDTTYAGFRGKPPEDKSAKARIAGYSPTATNKIARAGGAVENISSETLEGLSVEVTMKRADGTVVETRQLAVVPAVLAPGATGRFEFEYPIDAGEFQYVVTKLMGSNGQIIFATNQK